MLDHLQQALCGLAAIDIARSYGSRQLQWVTSAWPWQTPCINADILAVALLWATQAAAFMHNLVIHEVPHSTAAVVAWHESTLTVTISSGASWCMVKGAQPAWHVRAVLQAYMNSSCHFTTCGHWGMTDEEQ